MAQCCRVVPRYPNWRSSSRNLSQYSAGLFLDFSEWDMRRIDPKQLHWVWGRVAVDWRCYRWFSGLPHWCGVYSVSWGRGGRRFRMRFLRVVEIVQFVLYIDVVFLVVCWGSADDDWPERLPPGRPLSPFPIDCPRRLPNSVSLHSPLGLPSGSESSTAWSTIHTGTVLKMVLYPVGAHPSDFQSPLLAMALTHPKCPLGLFVTVNRWCVCSRDLSLPSKIATVWFVFAPRFRTLQTEVAL